MTKSRTIAHIRTLRANSQRTIFDVCLMMIGKMMKTKITQLSLAMLIAGISGMSAHAADNAIESANVLEFNDKSVLFVGDSQGGNIVAYETMAANNPKKGMSYGLFDLSSDIEKLLGVKNGDYLIKDLALHPESNEAYIALSVIEDGQYQPKIVIANQAGDVRLMDLGRKHTTLNVKHAPAESFMFYDKVNGRSLTFTDIEYHKGKLYISGLSNQDFKSSLRVADYPFTGKASFTSVEIYHAVHNQNETRAPIRTLTIANFNGEDHIVAAYTCTPLVTIPLSALKDGKHIVGKTVSELGYGNTPLDMISFTGQDMKQNKFPAILVTNKERQANVLPVEGIAAASAISTPSGFASAGFTGYAVPLSGLSQVADQDGYHIAALRRNAESGKLELVSYLKNLFFRLSEFQGEYEMPNFSYTEAQAKSTKPFQDMMKKDEGYPTK